MDQGCDTAILEQPQESVRRVLGEIEVDVLRSLALNNVIQNPESPRYERWIRIKINGQYIALGKQSNTCWLSKGAARAAITKHILHNSWLANGDLEELGLEGVDIAIIQPIIDKLINKGVIQFVEFELRIEEREVTQ